MSQPYAKVVADSIPEWGDERHRLITFEVCHHRFVLAEFNTHRVFSRNSASSRAIPVTKQLAAFKEAPAYPIEWASEKKGMQGGPPLEGNDLEEARKLFHLWHAKTLDLVNQYVVSHPIEEEGQVRLHKSLINRLLEPMQFHTVIVTATAWDNFFRQRVSPLAQPEIRVPAEMMLDAYKQSEPNELRDGEWHLPYIDFEDHTWAAQQVPEEFDGASIAQRKAWAEENLLVPVSAARCARVSYLTHDGKRDHAEDLGMFDRLTSADPMHASPLEHPAKPAQWNEHEVGFYVNPVTAMWEYIETDLADIILRLPKVGNFLGWQQKRLGVELDARRESFS